MRNFKIRPPQICVLGSADPGSHAYEIAADAGKRIAELGFTLVSGCGSPATRIAADRAIEAKGQVLSIIPEDTIDKEDWPCSL